MAARRLHLALFFAVATLVAPAAAMDRITVMDSADPFVRVLQPDDLALEDTGDVQPLRLFILLHDELLTERRLDGPFHALYGLPAPPAKTLAQVIDRVHEGYVGWWLADLSRKVLPGEPIRVTYLANLPGLTDLPYAHAGALREFAWALRMRAHGYRLPWGRSYRNKFILVTPENFGQDIGGLAYREGSEAVASLSISTSVIAHEVGHMLGAVHEDAETWSTGWWWCRTSMFGEPGPFMGHCNEYSAANRQRIRDHFQQGPGRPRALALTAEPEEVAD